MPFVKKRDLSHQVFVFAGETLGSYVAIVGSLVSGSFPATFYLNAQAVGKPQQVVLRAGPADFARTVLSFQSPEENVSSVMLGSSLTAVLRWSDLFGNVVSLEAALQVCSHFHGFEQLL